MRIIGHMFRNDKYTMLLLKTTVLALVLAVASASSNAKARRPATSIALERLEKEASEAYDESKHWKFVIIDKRSGDRVKTIHHSASFTALFDAYIQPHGGISAVEDGSVAWYIVEPNCDRKFFNCKVKPVQKEVRGAKGHKCMVTILEHAGRNVYEYYDFAATRGRIRFKEEVDVAIIGKQLKEEISQDASCKDAFKLWLKSMNRSLDASDYANLDDLAAEFKKWVDNNPDHTYKGNPKSKEYTARFDSRLFSRGVLPEYSHLRRHLESRLDDAIAEFPGFEDQVEEWKAHYAQQETPTPSDNESTSDLELLG